MFETTHDYMAFYIDKEHALADDVRDGALWLRDWPGTDEGLSPRPSRISSATPRSRLSSESR